MSKARPAANILLAGNVNVDVLMGRVTPWPQPGTEVLATESGLRVGGAAGNTALALAALGAPTQLIANVGNDTLGAWLQKQLSPAPLEVSEASTALTVGLSHPDGERTFISHLGHLSHYPAEALALALDGARAGDLLLLCGYFLLPPLRREARQLLQDAQARGLITLLDTGHPPEGWTPAVRQEVLDLLPHLDYFLPNHSELQGLTGETLAPALRRLAAHAPAQTVVKLGADGAGYLVNGEIRRVPAPRVNAIDTIGAGDTFNAGLLAALQRREHWRDVLGTALRAASLAISSSPRRYPSWEDVRGVH